MNKREIIKELESTLSNINHKLSTLREGPQVQSTLYNAKVNALSALLSVGTTGETFEDEHLEVDGATLVRLGRANLTMVAANSSYEIDELRRMLDDIKGTDKTIYFRIPRGTKTTR